MKRLTPISVLALAACALLEPAAEDILAVDRIVGETVQTARAPAADQKAALARAQDAFVAAPTPLARVRLAVLFASLPAPLRDDGRAVELLEPVANPNGPGVGRFAALLALQIAERQRLGREVERLAKERAAAERERQIAEKERDKREEALRQQLEALRSIERGILEREERLRSKPVPPAPPAPPKP